METQCINGLWNILKDFAIFAPIFDVLNQFFNILRCKRLDKHWFLVPAVHLPGGAFWHSRSLGSRATGELAGLKVFFPCFDRTSPPKIWPIKNLHLDSFGGWPWRARWKPTNSKSLRTIGNASWISRCGNHHISIIFYSSKLPQVWEQFHPIWCVNFMRFSGDLLRQLPGDIRVRYLSWDLVENHHSFYDLATFRHVWYWLCYSFSIFHILSSQLWCFPWFFLCSIPHHFLLWALTIYFSFIASSRADITQGPWRMHRSHFMLAFRPLEKPMPRAELA